ncbi:MAG: urease accessory protein UreE [Pseudomonadota bacterium]
MAEIPRAHTVLRGGAEAPQDYVALDYEGRFLRRRRLVTERGRAFLIDLAEVTSLGDGDALELTDGSRVGIRAAPEALLAVTGESLARLAWHIGNRHTPCRIEAERLLIRDDHVLAEMLRRLGANVQPLTAPFEPEGGAYGHGRTLGHSHGPEDGAGGHRHGETSDVSLDDIGAVHTHSHSHSHTPVHSHTQSHSHTHSHTEVRTVTHAPSPEGGRSTSGRSRL